MRYDILDSLFSETPWSIEENPDGKIVVFVPHQGSSWWVVVSIYLLNNDGTIFNQLNYKADSTWIYAGLANCTDKVSSGGFVLGNSVDEEYPDSRITLFRFDESGDTLWTREWEAASPYQGNIGYAAIETTDGGFLVVGTTYNEQTSRVLAIKTDSGGNEIWYKTYSGYGCSQSSNAALSACNTNDGGYIISAATQACAACVDNQYFFKVDSDGTQLWETILESDSDNGSVRVLNYGDGIYYGSGQKVYGIFDDDAKPWLMKFNDDGDTLWTRSYGEVTEFARYFSHPKKLSDGNLLLGGQWPGEGFDKGFLMKLDTAGHVIWDRKFYNVYGNHCRFNDYIELSDGYIAACGMANGDNDLGLNQDTWVVKVDSCGCLVPGCEDGASCSVGIEELNDSKIEKFMVYPNPVNGILNIYLSDGHL